MKEFIQKIKNLFKPINKSSDGYHTFDDLYDHRIALFVALLNNRKDHELCNSKTGKISQECWKSKINSDGTKWDGWFVAGIDDKITYHLPEKYWNKLHVKILRKGKWDGHTSKDVIDRLLDY